MIKKLFLSMLIKSSILILPLWNLEKAGINLLPEENQLFEKIIFEGTYNSKNLKLTKKISKIQNNIKEENIIKIDNLEENITQWEDIESFYFINEKYFICPKGKNYINIYDKDGKNGREIKPKITKEIKDDDWELLCYYQPDKNALFFAFLNSKIYKKLYAIKVFDNNEYCNLDIEEFFFLDFIWTNKSNENNQFNMFGLAVKNSNIFVQRMIMTLNSNYSFFYTGGPKIEIEESKLNYYGYYSGPDNNFYWINYYNTSDFSSGYCKDIINVSTIEDNIIKININKNDFSPLKFLEKTSIEYIKLIRNSKYAYYKIKSNNISYYGMIDIENNRVIFNTNEIIKIFKPLSKNSLLAITERTAYEICAIKSENNGCLEKCDSKNEIIDSEKYNHCGERNSCPNNILMPDNICINACNESIFIKTNNYCILCKDINNSAPFKLINEEGCLENKPENTYYINEDLKIIDKCHDFCKKCVGKFDNQCTECKNGYQLKNGKCIANTICFPSCSDCIEYSNNKNDQKCKSCIAGKLFQEDKGNCLDKCPDGYFQNDDFCQKCPSNFYFNYDDKKCYKCDDNCNTCSSRKENDNENCLSCKYGKLLINYGNMPKNCVIECPEGLSQKNGKCIKNNTNYMIWIFFILITIILLMIMIQVFKKIYISKKNLQLSQQIMTELQANE